MRNNASFDSVFEGLVKTTPEKLFLNFNLNAIEKEDDERSKLAKDIGLKPPIQIICSSMVTSAAFHQGIFKTAKLTKSERVLKLQTSFTPTTELIDWVTSTGNEPIIGDADWIANGLVIQGSKYHDKLSLEQQDKYTTSTHCMGVKGPVAGSETSSELSSSGSYAGGSDAEDSKS